MSERTEILEPLIRQFPLGLPFKRYAAVRELKLRSGAGKLDLAVFTDEPGLLLIEAKFRRNADAKDKVLGQLVFYFAHALECSSDEVIRALRRAATHKANQKDGYWNGQPRRPDEPMLDEIDRWIHKCMSRELRPEVRALIALDTWSNDRDDKRLLVPLRMLQQRGLPVAMALSTGEITNPFKVPKRKTLTASGRNTGTR